MAICHPALSLSVYSILYAYVDIYAIMLSA